MIERYYNLIKNWITERNPKERYGIIIICAVLTYMLWNLLWGNAIHNARKIKDDEFNAMNVTLATTEAQINTIMTYVSSPSYTKFIKEQQLSKAKLERLQNKIERILPTILNPNDLPLLTKDILNQQPGIRFVSLKSIAIGPLNEKNLGDIHSAIDLKNVKPYGFELIFDSTYFATINFLKRLEQLSWNLYWDDITYKVIQYPKAQVTVKFHVLINQAKN